MKKYPDFTLDRAIVKLLTFAPKSTVHGEERGSLADLELLYDAEATELAHFHPNLRQSFFTQPEDAGMLASGKEILTALRFPQFSKMNWDREIKGAPITIHVGTDRKESQIVLAECDIDKFTFVFKDGGRVDIGFRVRCRPTGPQAGKLYELIQTDLEVSLAPPSQQALDLE